MPPKSICHNLSETDKGVAMGSDPSQLELSIPPQLHLFQAVVRNYTSKWPVLMMSEAISTSKAK